DWGYAVSLVLPPISLVRWWRVAPLLGLVPACAVSFDDYPLGDRSASQLAGGQPASGGGSSESRNDAGAQGGLPSAASGGSGSGAVPSLDVGGGGMAGGGVIGATGGG